MKKYNLIIWDLDGTLADTSEGVMNCVRFAEKKMNLPSLSEEDYRKFIGPSNKTSYSMYYDLNGESLQQAIKYHKQYAVSKGYKEATVYSGIKQLLDEVKKREIKQAVVTLKQQESAEMFLRHHGLEHFFDCVIGAKGTDTQKDILLKKCLQELKTEPEKTILIGDSIYDQIGANKVGVDFLGVTYGFGFKTENDIVGLPYLLACHTVEEIERKIGE